MHTRPVGGMWMLAGRSDSRTWSGLRNPRAVFTARICTPPMTDAPATSLLKMWQSRSTMSCVTISGPSALPLSREPLGGAPTEIGVGELGGKTVQQLLGRVGLALGVVYLGQQPERLRIYERAHIVLEDQLEPLAGRARIALVDVVGGHPHLFLCEAPAADVDLGQAVGGVATLRILLHHRLERLQRLL